MLRREVVKMAGSLFGLGSGTPSRFPYQDRPQPSPGIGPGQSAVTRARVVIVSGPTGAVTGVFVYALGTVPAHGNPPVAWVSQSPADPYGNTLPSASGITIGTTASGSTAGLGAGTVILFGPGDFGAADMAAPGGGELVLQSPITSVSDVAALLELFSAHLLGYPVARVPAGTSFQSTGGSATAPTIITTDTRNTLALLNGWAGGPLRYWLNPDNTISVVGPVNPAAMTSTTIAQLPAGYVPSVGGDWPVAAHTATPPTQGAFVRISNTGAVIALNATVGSGIFGVAVTGCPLN